MISPYLSERHPDSVLDAIPTDFIKRSVRHSHLLRHSPLPVPTPLKPATTESRLPALHVGDARLLGTVTGGFSKRQAGLSPVESWFGIFPWLWDQALDAISTDRVQILIDRAFRVALERLRLIKRYPNCDPGQPHLPFARIRRFDVLRMPLPCGFGFCV